jgi:transposase
MCLKPESIDAVPEETTRIARAAYPTGNIYLQLRDEFGAIYKDEQFLALYPRRGQPAEAPWRLALVSVMQCAGGIIRPTSSRRRAWTTGLEISLRIGVERSGL